MMMLGDVDMRARNFLLKSMLENAGLSTKASKKFLGDWECGCCNRFGSKLWWTVWKQNVIMVTHVSHLFEIDNLRKIHCGFHHRGRRDMEIRDEGTSKKKTTSDSRSRSVPFILPLSINRGTGAQGLPLGKNAGKSHRKLHKFWMLMIKMKRTPNRTAL